MASTDIRPVDMTPTLVGRTITHAEYESDGSLTLHLDNGSVIGIAEYISGGVVAYLETED